MIEEAAMSNQEAVDRAVERKIDEYRQRFFAPTPVTIARWRRQEARRLNAKNQLPLPLHFPDDPPDQTAQE
jgi:hypothetical protein